jgi:hypothetical protein
MIVGAGPDDGPAGTAADTPGGGTGMTMPEPHAGDRTLERARWEVAALAGRLRTLEADRDAWRARHDEVARERDRNEELVRALRRSRSYRVGRALVSLARPSARVVRRLSRRAVTVVRPRGDKPPAGTAPAHVYVAIGLAPERLRLFTRALAQRIVVHDDHRPVVVTDCAAFRTARAPGVVLEYLPDARTWARHRPEVPWDDLLTDRLTRVFRDYGCERTAVVDPDRPPTLADLLG